MQRLSLLLLFGHTGFHPKTPPVMPQLCGLPFELLPRCECGNQKSCHICISTRHTVSPSACKWRLRPTLTTSNRKHARQETGDSSPRRHLPPLLRPPTETPSGCALQSSGVTIMAWQSSVRTQRIATTSVWPFCNIVQRFYMLWHAILGSIAQLRTLVVVVRLCAKIALSE